MKANNTLITVLLSVAALFLILSGCRTKKETLRSESTTNIEQNNDIHSSSSIQATNLVKQTWSDLSVSSDDLNIHNVKLNFSAPDSAGKQHLESAEITDINQSKHKQNNVQGTNTDSSNVNANTDFTDKSKLKATGKNKAKEVTVTKTNTPWWAYPLVLFLIVITLYRGRDSISKLIEKMK